MLYTPIPISEPYDLRSYVFGRVFGNVFWFRGWSLRGGVRAGCHEEGATQRFQGLLPESQDPILVLTGSSVPSSLDSELGT